MKGSRKRTTNSVLGITDDAVISETPADDFVLGMNVRDELMFAQAHDKHEKTLRNLFISHAVAGWKCGNYKFEKVLDMIEGMDDIGALGAWHCCAAEAAAGLD